MSLTHHSTDLTDKPALADDTGILLPSLHHCSDFQLFKATQKRKKLEKGFKVAPGNGIELESFRRDRNRLS